VTVVRVAAKLSTPVVNEVVEILGGIKPRRID